MNTTIIITIIICFTIICVVHMWTDAAKALFAKKDRKIDYNFPTYYNSSKNITKKEVTKDDDQS